MLGNKRIVCIIPARLGSTRFPKKVLAILKGRSLIQWVWEAANRIDCFDEVAFAIDSEETAEVIKGFGGKYYHTAIDCASGSDRLVELRDKVEGDIFVNWQGDEPFIHRAMIDDLLQSLDDHCDAWTLKKRLYDKSLQQSSHVAKVVTDHQGCALYFSRSLIPYYRDTRAEEEKIYYKHIGIYAFTKKALNKIAVLPPCSMEEAEQLEQLRFLYNGLKLRVHETQYEVFGIDLPEHLALAEARIESGEC